MIREELVIFISPSIVSGRSDLMDLQRKNADKSQLVRDLQSGTSVLPYKYADPDKQDQASPQERAQRRLWYLPEPKNFPRQAPSKPGEKRNIYKGHRR